MRNGTTVSEFWLPTSISRPDGSMLNPRGIEVQEVNIEDDPEAEDLVIRVNHGRRKVPTIQVGDRYFACSPFNAQQLATELNIPLHR